MPARTGGVDEQWREALDPAVDADVVDLDAPLGQQLLDIAVRQAISEIPADRQHDHLGRETKAGKG